jgi:hypothetical protein
MQMEHSGLSVVALSALPECERPALSRHVSGAGRFIGVREYAKIDFR